MWRIRLYVTTAKAYERCNEYRTAQRVIERGFLKVAQIREWEEADPPIPKETHTTLSDAVLALRVFHFKYRFLSGQWTDAQAVEQVTSAMGGVDAHVIAAVLEALSDPTRRVFHAMAGDKEAKETAEPKALALFRFAFERAAPFVRSFITPPAAQPPTAPVGPPPSTAERKSAVTPSKPPAIAATAMSAAGAVSVQGTSPAVGAAAGAGAGAAGAATGDEAASVLDGSEHGGGRASPAPSQGPSAARLISRAEDAASVLPLQSHFQLLRLAFSHAQWAEYLTLHKSVTAHPLHRSASDGGHSD
jgi:hypothetical protein